MKARTIARLVCGFALGWLALVPARGAITPNALFSDNAVLQQKVKLPVWGTTEPRNYCTWSVYKDPQLVPAEAYRRVGSTKPGAADGRNQGGGSALGP